jgi:hypothetical protein
MERRNKRASDLTNALLTARSAKQYKTKYIKLLVSAIQVSGISIQPTKMSKKKKSSIFIQLLPQQSCHAHMLT